MWRGDRPGEGDAGTSRAQWVGHGLLLLLPLGLLALGARLLLRGPSARDEAPASATRSAEEDAAVGALQESYRLALEQMQREGVELYEADEVELACGGESATGSLSYRIVAVLREGHLSSLRFLPAAVTVERSQAAFLSAASAAGFRAQGVPGQADRVSLTVDGVEERIALGLVGWGEWDEPAPAPFTGCSDGLMVPIRATLLPRAFVPPPPPSGATFVPLVRSVTFDMSGEAECTAAGTSYGRVALAGELAVEVRSYGIKDIDGGPSLLRTSAATSDVEALGAALARLRVGPLREAGDARELSFEGVMAVEVTSPMAFSRNELRGFEPRQVVFRKVKRPKREAGYTVEQSSWTTGGDEPAHVMVELSPPLLAGVTDRAERGKALERILDQGPDGLIAAKAALMVAEEGLTEALPALHRCLADPSEEPTVVDNVVFALARLKQQESFMPLVQCLGASRERRMRLKDVACALRAIDAARATQVLGEIAAGPDAERAEEARELLEFERLQQSRGR